MFYASLRKNIHHIRCTFYVLLTVHLNNLCNENQLDALFIFLFFQSTSTCFGHVYCPSSGGIRCICTAIGTCYTLRWLAAGRVSSVPKSKHVPIAEHIQCILPDDGQKICPKYVEVDWRSKLRINSSSSWFSLQVWCTSFPTNVEVNTALIIWNIDN
jgi:hypothetical protein